MKDTPFSTLLTPSSITIQVSLFTGISPNSGAELFFLLNTTMRSQGTISCLLYLKCFLIIIEFIAFQYSSWTSGIYASAFGYEFKCSVFYLIANFCYYEIYGSPSVGMLLI